MFDAKKLREERAALIRKAQEVNAEFAKEHGDDAAFDAETAEKIEKMNADVSEYDGKIKTAELREAIPADAGDRPEEFEVQRSGRVETFGEEDACSALAGFITAGLSAQTERMRFDLKRSGLPTGSNEFTFELGRRVPDYRTFAQVVNVNSKGGFTVPELALGPLEKALQDTSEIRRFAKVLRTDRGGPYPLASVTNTIAPELRAETEAVTFSEVTFGKSTIGESGVSAGVKMSIELLQDSVYNVQGTIEELLREALAEDIAARYADGTASTAFDGLWTGSANSAVELSLAKPTYEELVDVQHAVNRRARANAVWIMSDSALKYCRYVVDGNGQPMFAPGTLGAPDTLLGKPIVVEKYAPDYAASAAPIIFGDPSKFLIRDVRQVRVTVLKELYAATGEVGLIAHYRGASKVHDLEGDSLVYATVAAA